MIGCRGDDCPCWDCRVERSEWLDIRAASGIEAYGRDRETGRDAKHESPAPKGDAPEQSSDTSEEEK